MELRHLRYYVAVAEELHFGRAAKRLGIAQPPLSQQIRRLEQELGCELFDRGGRRGVRLTAAGEALLPDARRLLEDSSAFGDAARRAARGQFGVLTIGFAASAILSPLRAAIRAFRSTHPGVELRLRELSTEAQSEALERRSIDVAVMREPAPLPGIESETLLREPFLLALPGHHPLAGAESVALAAVCDEPFVLFPREVSRNLYDRVRSLFDEAGVAPVVVQEALEWQTIMGLVDAGLGISVVPASFRDLRIGRVAYVPLAGSTVTTEIVLCHRSSPPSRLVGEFLQAAHAAADALM